MSVVLEVKNLEKKYAKKTALKGISLELAAGKIYGLLGPNGSGKTTLLKVCAALLKNYSGEVLIGGNKPGLKTKAIVLYLPDKDYLYDWMTVKDAVRYFTDFYQDFVPERAKELLDFMELKDDDSIKTLSKGMRARVKISLVLARKAKLYLLDEPFAGIDAVTIEKLLEIILQAFSPSSTMLLTTHHMTYVESLLEDIILLNKGEIVFTGSAEEIRAEKGLSISELYMEVFKDVEST